MVDLKTAIANAIRFLEEVTAPAGAVRIEEVESRLDNGHEVWRITLSTPNSVNFEFVRGRPARDYKVVSVDKSNGEPFR
jgi:hypothetical protein